MRETWKLVEGYENYKVSNLGNVKSLTRTVDTVRYGEKYTKVLKGKTLTQTMSKGGMVVHLSINGVRSNIRVNRLVFLAFNGSVPWRLEYKDGDKTNNSIKNLKARNKA